MREEREEHLYGTMQHCGYQSDGQRMPIIPRFCGMQIRDVAAAHVCLGGKLPVKVKRTRNENTGSEQERVMRGAIPLIQKDYFRFSVEPYT